MYGAGSGATVQHPRPPVHPSARLGPEPSGPARTPSTEVIESVELEGAAREPEDDPAPLRG
jgi:hypothetical protein